MGDLYFDLENEGGAGVKPVTAAGRVAYNCRLDQEDLEDRKRKGAANTLWPTANMDDVSQHVLPNSICLTKRLRPTRKQTDGMLTVFSTLNGLQLNGMTRRQLIESLSFGAISGGGSTAFDTSGNAPRFPEFGATVGGLYTILNNGPKRIMNGQWVYWELPPDGIEHTELGRRESLRITPWTMPYLPSQQSVTAEAVKDAIRSGYQRGGKPSEVAGIALATDDAALAIKRFALQLTVNAFAALLEGGIVAFDPAALASGVGGNASRATNADAWRRLSPGARENAIVAVAMGLGTRNMPNASGSDRFIVPGESASLGKRVCDLLTFDETLIAHQDTVNVPSGHKGEVMRGQESSIKTLLVGVEKATSFVKDRIFAKCLTPAAPGKAMDILINGYSAA